MDYNEYKVIPVYPEANNLSADIQAAVSTGHLWVKAVPRDRVVYLVFAPHIISSQLAEYIVDDQVAVLNGS